MCASADGAFGIVVYSVFVDKIPEARVAVHWLALVINSKELLFRCISFTPKSLFLWLKFQEYEEFRQLHGFASGTFPKFYSEFWCKNKQRKKNKLKLHFSVKAERVSQALENLRCFYQICFPKLEMFSLHWCLGLLAFNLLKAEGHARDDRGRMRLGQNVLKAQGWK